MEIIQNNPCCRCGVKQENFMWRDDPDPKHRCRAMKLQWWPQCTADTTKEELERKDEGKDIEMETMQSQAQGDEEQKTLLEHSVEVV